MHSLKFIDLNILSNRKSISNSKTIIFLYGLGCCSEDFSFILKFKRINWQLLIPELPGHNNSFYPENMTLEKFAKQISLLIKKKGFKDVIFFAHSVGGIIPILIANHSIMKNLSKKKFINYEGNLTSFDTITITKKTASYDKLEFKKKFENLIKICENSKSCSLRMWSKSLKKTNVNAFYKISKEAVFFSNSHKLLYRFRGGFKKKIYLSGSNTNFYFSELFFGTIRYKIKNCGHFSFFENSYEFLKNFSKLIYGRILN